MTPGIPSEEQVAEERAETEVAAHRLLRAAGFFSWGHDSWCHDEPGIGCVTTAEALDTITSDDGVLAILTKGKVLS